MEEGYDVSIVSGHLVVRNVPYVGPGRQVRRGVLAVPLRLAGDQTAPPGYDHQAYFAGALPCGVDGRPLTEMVHACCRREIGGGLVAEHMLCSRPLAGKYGDYHALVTTFVAQLSSPAAALDPTATATGRTGHVIVAQGDMSSFNYVDTASARHGITALTERLAGHRIAIAGLGGTGGYVLDQIAKCPVQRIHLFDDDVFEQHSAWRAPGAPTVAELGERLAKTDYFDRIYSRMHRGLVPHRMRLGPNSFRLLDHVDFVFLCIDDAVAKEPIVRELERRGLGFIDVGLGLHVTDAGLTGAVRVTTSTPMMRGHVWDKARIPMSGGAADDPYSTRVQVADLNMLNAALAVIRWKRLLNFYVDLENEHSSIFTIDGNHLLNEDVPEIQS